MIAAAAAAADDDLYNLTQTKHI